jgi:hypothetical protein
MTTTSYRTACASDAARFNGVHHALQFAKDGFTPEELPRYAQRAGETHGLRDHTGDWIVCLHRWERHRKPRLGDSVDRANSSRY